MRKWNVSSGEMTRVNVVEGVVGGAKVCCEEKPIKVCVGLVADTPRTYPGL